MKNKEFTATKFKDTTVYTLESATGGGTSASAVASVSNPMGGARKRGDNLIAQEANTDKIDASKPRNFVAKNAKTGGAGAHKDKKKAAKQGDVKHKNKEMAEDDSALQAFLSKGGTVQQLPYKKPRKADKTDYGSKHIGGSGDKMKASRTGTAAKTQGSKVVGVAEVNNPAFARNSNGMSIANDPNKCFNLGYNAAKFGKTRQDCPYKPGSSSAKNWIAGWINSKESGPLQKGVAEGGEKDRQWSNKDMERLRVATRDFDDIMASDGPDQTKHDLIKKRIQTKPMAGPKGVLPEQGVAEGLNEFAPAPKDDGGESSGNDMDAAYAYIQKNYPSVKKYAVRRAVKGFRAVDHPKYRDSGDPAGIDQAMVRTSLAQQTGVKDALKYLQLQLNPNFSGSKDVSFSIGWSWYVFENLKTGIAVLYYADRGLGGDEVVVAGKTPQIQAQAREVFRDAGVLPTPTPRNKKGVAEGLQARLAELKQKIAEVSADPAYLRSAERSRQDARDTQRQYWRSPEEKAAARSTEIKRDKGIAGYTTRHKAANPDMYPTPKMRPAKATRDPHIDRSDDYTTWKQGQSEDHSTATGGWGKGSYATAGKDTSRWTGAGRDDSVHESDEYFNKLAESLNKVQEKMMPASAFAGSKKNKLGTAGQWRNSGSKKNRPARQGDLVGGAEESIAKESAPKGWKGTVKAMKKHKEIDNPFALANYMKKKGAKPHYPNVGEDAYAQEFDVALERVLQPNDPVEKWNTVFQAADFNRPGNFQFGKYNPENRTPEKRERMAKAASYAAKNPSKKK